MPPTGVAVAVIVVPAGCGAGRFVASDTDETRALGLVVVGGVDDALPEIGNATLADTSSVSAVLPALFTHTPT